MKFKSLLIGMLLLGFYSFGQVKELEKFRKEITFFINYDLGKIDSTPKTDANSTKFRQNVEKAFLEFIMHKDSQNLDNLKSNSINNKTDYIIGNNNYSFTSLRVDPYKKSLENNVYYQVVFYPIYDYQLSSFVSFYIQPFTISEKQYIIYYYKLNGEGTYYIKDNAKNKIVFESQALTSNAPIAKFELIDNNHFLLVEDMGYNGQRAFVITTENNQWKTINAFKGRSFKLNSFNYESKNDGTPRKYLRFVNNRSIQNNYPVRYFKDFEISFDTKTQMISYKKLNNVAADAKKIESKWENKTFTIDDYYVGENLNDHSMPH